MNPLAAISKNLRELETSYGKIRTPETGEKARVAIRETANRMGLCFQIGPSAESVAPTVVLAPVGSVTLGEKQDAPASVSVGSVFVSKEEWKDGTTTVFPADYKPFVDEGERGPGVCDPEIEGDLPGQTGTFYPETVTSEVNQIGGWPEYSQVQVIGLFPNRRSLKGTLPDGRTVHVERKMDWKVGMVKGRLVRAGAAPLFRVMA